MQAEVAYSQGGTGEALATTQTTQLEILDWQGVLAADPATVGGKAGHLARLKQLGLPVPEGVVIPAGWRTLHDGLGARSGCARCRREIGYQT